MSKTDINAAVAQFVSNLFGEHSFETLDRQTLRDHIKDPQKAYMKGDRHAVDLFEPMIEIFCKSPLLDFLPEDYTRPRAMPADNEVLVVGSQNKSLLVLTIPLAQKTDNTLELGEKGITLSALASDVCGALYAVHRYGGLLEDRTEISVAFATFLGRRTLGRKYTDAHWTAGIHLVTTGKMLKHKQTSGIDQDLQIDFIHNGLRIGSQTPYQNLEHLPKAFAAKTTNLNSMLRKYDNTKVFIAGGAPAGPTNPGYVGEELAIANAHNLVTVADLKNRLDPVGFMAVISNADYVHLNKD